ncbi:MAG: periplasmic heavy metal sensor [Geminicoccaceae bacterium]
MVGTLILLTSQAVVASPDGQPYRGQQDRAIKAMDVERLDGLRNGAGLGYAKPAELNGWPGPLHALELADELGLSDRQRQALSALRQSMLAKARPLGNALIDAELQLDELFRSGEPSPGKIAAATARSATLEGELRAVHLRAHLEAKPLLNHHQLRRYQQSRGYGRAHQRSDHGQ